MASVVFYFPFNDTHPLEGFLGVQSLDWLTALEHRSV
jgi:hypothetical protein